MANNRIYLKCKACGETLYLGKRLTDGYYHTDYPDEDGNIKPLGRKLNDFYEKHTYCNDHGLDCFEIEYEIDPEF